MSQKTIKHEIKLQKSVIIILGLLSLGLLLNTLPQILDVKEASARHFSTPVLNHGTMNHPFIIECKKGCS